jgi:hypothetical protein
MTWVAVAVAGGSVVSGIIGGNAAKKAAQIQADAQARAQEQLRQTGIEASKQFTPYAELGQSGLNYLNQQLPYLSTPQNVYQPQANYTPMTNADLNAQLAPNYAFQLQQGQGAQNAAANVAGGMISGNALRGLQDYTQNFAGNAYQNALKNYMGQYSLGLTSNMEQQQQAFNQGTANQTNIYNRLAGISGIGMQGATGAANALLGSGTNIAQLSQGIGQSQAAGQMGMSNALSNAVTGVANAGVFYGLNQNNQINPYVQAAKLNQQYGANNVYGLGGGGTVPAGVVDYNVEHTFRT